MHLMVRPAVPREYVAAGELCVAAYRADGQLEPPPPPGHAPPEHSYADVLGDVAGRVADAEVLVAVDMETDALVGCVTLVQAGTRYAELAGPGEAEFRMLAVAPDAQGRGVGGTLVRACLDRAGELGRSALVICVRDFNETAKRLYARYGFVRVPELDFVPVPGVVLEALRLELPTG